MFDQFFYLLEHSSVFFISFVTILSLLVGSFLNVVIYRLPVMMEKQWACECRELLEDELKNPKKSQKQSEQDLQFNLVKPDSHCPSCNAPVKAWQNIPVLSYLLLKGKCGSCANPISMRYPAIELLTAVASAIVAVKFGYSLETVFLVLLTWVFVCLIFIDIDKMLLPDQLTLPLLWLMLMASVWNVFLEPKWAIIGAAAGYLSLWFVYWGFKLLTGKEGMGFGDFKLLAVIGATVGIVKLPMVILLSSAVGAVIGLSMMAFGDKTKNSQIPFGPYLAIAGWLTMLWGDEMLNGYLSLL
ncbi:prepilin peptidase [Psychrosphaera aestuarii]|uniref:prepilin peptidase n=1 Tax=Psychrosphaera aestuarii TaxID=1266052 RepID=UPI001B331A68|nr:A24 family peptidase [Psychrosphaera aestuarii]